VHGRRVGRRDPAGRGVEAELHDDVAAQALGDITAEKDFVQKDADAVVFENVTRKISKSAAPRGII
jgi:hypothetical protein